MENSLKYQKKIIEKLDLEKKFSNPDFVDFNGDFKMESASKGFMESYGQKTYVEKKGEDLFGIGDIEGTSKDVIEIADFINKAKLVAKQLIETAENKQFIKDKDTGRPLVVSKTTDIVGIDCEGDCGETDHPNTKTRFLEIKPILSETIRKSSPEDNIIKQNIDKILNYLNQNK